MAISWKKKIARHAGKVVVRDAARSVQTHLRRSGPDYEAQLSAIAAIAATLALSLRAWRYLDQKDS